MALPVLLLRLFVCTLTFHLTRTTTIKPHVITEQPEWIKQPCKKNDTNLNNCIAEVFQNMFPYMAKGIPEVGIPRFEPLFIDKIGISKGAGAVTLAGNFNRLFAHGPSNTTTKYAKVDLKKGRLDMGLYIPQIITQSQYTLNGKILLLSISGVGDARLLLRDVVVEVYMNVYFIKLSKDIEVMQVKEMVVDFRMASCRIHLDNLFNGNKVLGHTMNLFLNKHALEIIEELKENIGESLSEVFKKIMNDGFGRIPTKFWLQG